MGAWSNSLCCSLLMLISLYVVNSEVVEINTTFGHIRGVKAEINNHSDVVYVFRKIPFAVPPVGHLRFQKPVSHGPVSGVYDATTFGPSCIQTLSDYNKPFLPNRNISEDCLHLNIFVPHTLRSIPRAVMLWIHGGGFEVGEGTIYDASYLAARGDVIVVTINYRLGLFGFFSTEDKDFPGNYGLWDQVEAIKWTRKHIASFGGDPNRITIFGESAGAISVGYLVASPVADGLFQRAILESGGIFKEFAVNRQMKTKAVKALNYMGCLNGTHITKDAINCLLRSDKMKILKAAEYVNAHSGQIVAVYNSKIGPSIDGELIRAAPERMMKNTSSPESKVFRSVDLLMGTNSADGGLLLGMLAGLQQSYNFSILNGVPTSVLCQVIGKSLTDQYYKSNSKVAKSICDAYTNHAGEAEQARDIVNLAGDWIFGAPMKSILDLHVTSPKNTFQYLFSKEPSRRWTPLPPWFRGANHGDEIPYVFGLNHFVPTYSSAELSLSHQIMRYWTNFAKTGNPNHQGSGGTFWPSYKHGKAYLQLGDHVTARQDLNRQRFDLFLNTIPHILVRANQPDETLG